ncbi:MAG TPA: cysteine desulfurase-like protein [Rhodospirillales bacterium]|nr:cysteine desulfurase-like protein [Rhodospirillales bacterium]
MVDAPTLDVDFARRQFPDSAWAWAFFENAGGSFVPRSVIQRLGAYMAETQVQPGAPFPASASAARRMAEGQRRIAEMINAGPDEIVVGPSTTANIYVLANALRPWFAAGDEIIVTNLDHEANNGAWRRLAETGLIVREWKVDAETAELDPAGLERLLGERTRLVCVSHCSNIVGTFNDVAAIAGLAHAAGALVCVDGVAYAPHRAIDVKALDVDFYALSPYKLYGPHLGVLYGKRQHLLRARGQNHYFIGEDDIPLKLNPGGPNHELTAALVGTADYFEAMHGHHFEDRANSFHERVRAVYGLFAAYEEELAAPFVEFLSAKPGVRLIGRPTANPAERAPTFSFVVEGRRSTDTPALVEPSKVAIRSGHFYAHRLINDLGIDPDDGVVRVSMVHYNTAREVERLIRALDRAF